MKYSIRRLIYVFAVFSLLMPVLVRAQATEDSMLVIRGGWLFDGIKDTRRANSGIIVQNGMIIEVDNMGPAPAGATVIELSDNETILPGLIDTHAHYNLDLVDNGRVEEVVHNGTIFLANGVTSTWSAGEYYPERVIARRDLIDAGEAIGPRLFASGPYFGAFRCEYNIKVSADDCIGWPNDITEDEIRAEVDKWAAQGVISIKIKQATPGEASILIDQAHKNGMTTGGHLVNYHVEFDVSTRDAILLGMDRIDHQLTPALSADDPRSADTPQMVDMMIKHQVYYGPNLQMYGSIDLRNDHLDEMVWVDESQYFTPYAQELLIKRGPPGPEASVPEYEQRVIELMALYNAGGGNLITAGTDEPVYTSMLPGFAYHRELLAMTYAGLPEAVVLKAATINGAASLDIDDKLGSVEVGKLGDLLVVRGNPLDDIKVVRDIRIVIKDGVAHDPEALLRTAEGGIGPKGPDDHKDWSLELRPLRMAE